jgi:hypothetical protein
MVTKMFVRIKKYFFATFILLLINCSDYEPTLVFKELPAFDDVELHSVFDVYLIQDSTYSIKIEADEEMINSIFFEVENHILSVRNKQNAKWVKPESNKVKLFITAAGLKRITAFETCSIQTVNTLSVDEFAIVMAPSPKLTEINLDLDCGYFNYWNNYQCGGKLILKGSATNIRLTIFSLMAVDAKALTSDNALVTTYSHGDCELMVNRRLEYSIHGEGNILLQGNPPEIHLNERTSTGKLIQLY